MNIFFLLFTVVVCQGSSLWPVLNPDISKSDLGFTVTRQNDGRSVFIKAFLKDSTKISQIRQIKFILFSRLHIGGTQLQFRDNKSLVDSGFDFNKETKLIIHGFANSASSRFTEYLKNAYLKTNSYNILIIDWSALCRPPFYASAVENARLVGVVTAQMVESLITQGVTLSRLHVVGHSIGAHIAGIAGHHLRRVGQLARITGLDPAKPMFETEPHKYRLDSQDAVFVDCIHTCGGFIGQSEPHCSVDFYPNDGTNPQPGCTFDFFGICSHQSSYRYFAESVIDPMAFRAVRCSAVENYSPVNCSTTAEAYMGEYTDNRTRGIFYLATAPMPPYSMKGPYVTENLLTKFSWYFYSSK